MSEEPTLDDPVRKRQVVTLLLKLSPFTFALCYVLAWAQGAATGHAVLIAVVGAGMCLGAALAIHIMGSKAWMAAVALKIAAMLVAKR